MKKSNNPLSGLLLFSFYSPFFYRQENIYDSKRSITITRNSTNPLIKYPNTTPTAIKKKATPLNLLQIKITAIMIYYHYMW